MSTKIIKRNYKYEYYHDVFKDGILEIKYSSVTDSGIITFFDRCNNKKSFGFSQDFADKLISSLKELKEWSKY